MAEKQMQAGMNWVVERLSELGQDQGLSINSLGWDADTVDHRASRHDFVVLLNGQRQVVTFDDADLEAVPVDLSLQLEVAGDLRAFLNDQLRGSLLPG